MPFARARFRSDYRNPSQVLADLAAAYPHRLVWGSDAPFYSYVSSAGEKPMRMACSYEEEARPLRELSKEIQERISFHNALSFLGMKQLPA